MAEWPEARVQKFRLAAFVYLHVAVLYEAAAYVMWRRHLIPTGFGPPVLWLIIGSIVAGAVFVGILKWRNVWFVRAVWLMDSFRLPPLLDRAYVLNDSGSLTRSFYLTAMVVVVINLWMLARAGWDL